MILRLANKWVPRLSAVRIYSRKRNPQIHPAIFVTSRNHGLIDYNLISYLPGFWTIDTGPRVNQLLDMWEGIEKDLEDEDVASAAFKLCRGSEDIFEYVCDAIGAQVTYNSVGQWQLDDWHPAASSVAEGD